jgi:predicted anti-sigma-YlaC factor YlaD
MMQCETLVNYLSDYLDHQLSEELEAAAREHLMTCQNCQVMLDSTQRVIRLYHETGREATIPAARRQRLYDQLEALLRAPNRPPDSARPGD